jgi:hypothetical protein
MDRTIIISFFVQIRNMITFLYITFKYGVKEKLPSISYGECGILMCGNEFYKITPIYRMLPQNFPFNNSIWQLQVPPP